MIPSDKKVLGMETAPEIMADCAKLGFWEIFIKGTEYQIHMDEQTSCVFGLKGENTLDFFKLLEKVHPDDALRVKQKIMKSAKNIGSKRMLEYRIMNKEDGSWKWVRSFCKSFALDDSGNYYLIGGTQDIHDSLAFQSFIEQMNEAKDRTQIMLDATPLCSNFWDENFNNIDCNEAAVKLFELKNKKEYLDRFFELSPKHQPNGRLSSDVALENITTAFRDGKCVFEWMHQKLNGEQIPAEITLVRVKRDDKYIVVGYTRDLREYKKMISKMREADERTQIMLDATPLCSNFWDENYNNIDCNQAAANLFDLPSKQAYLDNFNKLSPVYQPNGRLSSEIALENITTAFRDGKCVFEWMHQKLNGEQIPAEITLVRVKRDDKYIVVGYTRDLREYKKMISKMREADERTQIMLDATPLCSNFWDENYNNIDCNQAAANLFDLPSKQAYLDNFNKLSPVYQPNGRLSSEIALENITTAFRDGKCVFEWMHQKLNGEQIPAEITLVRVKRDDKYIVVGYTRDLREYKKMMTEKEEANERTQIMLDATPLCCNLWDESFNNIDCNEAAVKLFELKDKKEYLDRFFELSPVYQPNGRLSSEIALENITTAFRDGKCVFEWMHQKLNGEQIPAEITLVRVKRGDKYIVAGYTRDLREYKKMMGEIKEVEADLRLARDAAEESAKSKSEFLANMSHEIRTPMNAVLGMLHLIQNDSSSNFTSKQEDYLSKAEQSAKTLLRIINDILDFSKIEAGMLEMENVAFDIEQVLKQMNDMFEETIATKGLNFNIVIPENIPHLTKGDPLRLAQVLLNLISNSIKFTHEGGITLSVKQIAKKDNKVLFLFTVKDTGIGMTEDQVKRLFTPFTQADTSTTRKYGGTGLGLAISKKLVNMMHGEIWCVSSPNNGAEFNVTSEFEVLTEKETINKEIVDKEKLQSVSEIKCEKPILLVEDNEINQIIADELLKAEGYVVDIANNGREAVEKIMKNDYQLVLMDIQMPIMDGIEATKEIRSNEKYANLPIIAMTAHAMSGDREKSIQSGMNDHITKPIQPDILYNTLKKWIQ